MKVDMGKRIIEEWIILFVLAAFAGWLYEVGITFLAHGQYEDRGVLHLPLCPIYGFGILLLVPVLKRVRSTIAVFFYSAIITTVIELAASYVLEYGFQMVLWSYGDWPFHFQTRISLFSSLIFGVFAVVFIRLILPYIHRACGQMNIVFLRMLLVLTALVCLIVEIGVGQGVMRFPFYI